MISEAEKATLFAKNYVRLVEALMKEGVIEETARAEARMAAMVHLTMMDDATDGSHCPLCGK